MSRAVVNVATGRYLAGQERLARLIPGENYIFHKQIPRHWPSHTKIPYAFKAFALKEAAETYNTLLWCDASIVTTGSLKPIWEHIEREGYIIWNNGYSNAEWCCDDWYPECFPFYGVPLEEARAINQGVRHVVATAFGLDTKHPTGQAILAEYFRFASETRAFCGPWWNANSPQDKWRAGAAPCGPPSVRGHRHDQSCLSLIAHRLGLALVEPPNGLAYRGHQTLNTILCVDGEY
jgi:hypothetical protein